MRYPTNRPTDQPTNRRTRPLIEMRTHLKRRERKRRNNKGDLQGEEVAKGRSRRRRGGKRVQRQFEAHIAVLSNQVGSRLLLYFGKLRSHQTTARLNKPLFLPQLKNKEDKIQKHYLISFE